MLSALGFLTVAGGAHHPDERTLRWFPLVGAAIGGVLAAVWIAAGEVWSPAVAAVLLIGTDLALTGMLHFDGLVDSTDGLLPHLDRERRLEVMRTPDIGAFALTVVPMVLLARWASLATDRIEPLAFVAVWGASRTLMAVVPSVLPYARSRGLATAFLDGARRWYALWFLPAGVLLVIAHGVTGAFSLVVGLAGAAAVLALAVRRIAGYTGDVLGASAVVLETVALVVLSAR